MPAPPLQFTVSGTLEEFYPESFGSLHDGKSDDSVGIIGAINAAALYGGKVKFGPWTYQCNPAGLAAGGTVLAHTAGAKVILQGFGRDLTSLLLGPLVASKDLLHMTVDGDQVLDMTLDTQTNNGQSALVVVANYTELRRCRINSGSNAFSPYYAGPVGASLGGNLYNVGNIVDDLILNTTITAADDFSWSFQSQGFVRNVIHTGTRIAIYGCIDCDVEDYEFTSNGNAGSVGYWITNPSANVRIANFTYHVTAATPDAISCGIIGTADPTYVSTGILVVGQKVRDPGTLNKGMTWVIGDAKVVAIGCVLDSNAGVSLSSSQAATNDVSFVGCTVPSIAAGQLAGATVRTRFLGCLFPAFTPHAGQNANTFANFNGRPWICDVLGGRWTGAGLLFGSGNTFTVRGLGGYNPQAPAAVVVTASPWTYTNSDPYDEDLHVIGGTVSGITKGGVAVVSPVFLAPGDAAVVTYTIAPTGSKVPH